MNFSNALEKLSRLPVWFIVFKKLGIKLLYLTKDGQILSFSSQLKTSVANANSSILVLSRFAYDEQQKVFPIVSKSDLNKVLKSQYPGAHFFYISNVENNQRRVSIITVNNNLLALCQQAKMVIPISTLIACQPENPFKTLRFPDGEYFQLTRSPFDYQAVLANSLVKNASQARNLLGAHLNISDYVLKVNSEKQAYRLLFSMPLAFWLSSLNQKRGNSFSGLMPFAALSVSLLACYLLVLNVYMPNQLQAKQQQLSQLNHALGPLLDIRNRIQAVDDVNIKLADSKSQSAPLAFWELLALAEMHNVQLTSVEASFDIFTLTGTVASATTWLQALLDEPMILTADFIAPVRRVQNGQEQFTISITLKEPAGTLQAREF